MADLQNKKADFLFKLDEVRITNVKHPILINSELSPNKQSSICLFSFSSTVDRGDKGTNMSRFTEQLNQFYEDNQITLHLNYLKLFTKQLADRLKTDEDRKSVV